MKYSIIIPYRDREKHLEILLPRLLDYFKNEEFEIIICEQDDNLNFRIAILENIGYLYSKGNIVIFHQVDYYPSDNVNYEVDDVPVLPAKNGIFLNDELKLRDIKDIPAGYRKWEQEIDPNFYGGIIAMKREHFEKINGFNPLYIGWGNEDEDIRERFKWNNIIPKRNEEGTFFILNHKDNCPIQGEDRYKDFVEGRKMLMEAFKYRHKGYKDIVSNVHSFNLENYTNVLWLKINNYKVN